MAVVAQNLSERISRWLSMQRKKIFTFALLLIVVIGLWSGYTLWSQRRLISDNQLLANLKTQAASWEDELNDLENEQAIAAENQENEQVLADDTEEVEQALADDTEENEVVEDTSEPTTLESTAAAPEEPKEDFAQKIIQHNSIFASYLQQLIDGDSGDLPRIEALWWQAKLYEKQENLLKAQESLQRIYENYPTSLRAEQAQLRSAILAYQNDNVEEAVAELDQLRANDSGIGVVALLQLGLISMQLQDYAKAREIFEEMLNQLEGRSGLEAWNTLARNQLIALDVLAANPS